MEDNRSLENKQYDITYDPELIKKITSKFNNTQYDPKAQELVDTISKEHPFLLDKQEDEAKYYAAKGMLDRAGLLKNIRPETDYGALGDKGFGAIGEIFKVGPFAISKEHFDRLKQELYPDYDKIVEGIEKDHEKTKEKILDSPYSYEDVNFKDIGELKFQLYRLAFRKDENKLSEIIQMFIKQNYSIFSTRDDIKSEIWFYQDGIYVPNGISRIKEICRDLLSEAYTPQRVNRVVAKIEADTYIDSDIFFNQALRHTWEVPVLNGILNLKTRILQEFTPKKVFFNKCPIRYDPSATCENIDKFLADILAHPEDRQVYYEIGGYCLLNDQHMEKAFIFSGGGRNGKGKSIELLKRVIGAENCIGIPLVSLRYDNPNVADLFGKKINMAGDIGDSDLKDTSMFKSLTGRDTISIPRKYLKAITFVNTAKFVFACNQLPRVYDTSKGFWERWVLLEYPYYFADEEEMRSKLVQSNWKIKDPNILDKVAIPSQLSGLLNKFLDGLDRIIKDKRFSSTKGSEDVKNYWIRKSHSFMAFCMDMIEESIGSYISKKEIRSEFAKYCKRHKLKGASDKDIKITLENEFGVVESRKSLYSMNETDYVWEGIKWKSSH